MQEISTPVALSTNDPLLYDFPRPYVREFFPMGFPLRLSTNSREVMAAAEAVWGTCQRREGAFDVIEIRLGVDPTFDEPRPAAAMPRGQGHLMSTIHSAANYTIGDTSRGFAYGWLTRSVVEDPAYLRFHFLEALAYSMISLRYLAPVHAACVEWQGSGILLCGDSGAGKTSLSYACARRGWTFVADDACYLVRAALDCTIVGRPEQMRFRSSAHQLFPELEKFPAALCINGKMDIEAITAEMQIGPTGAGTQARALVFLNRRESGRAKLSRFPAGIAREWLHAVASYGEDAVREQQRQALDQLLELPLFELTYQDFDQAERLLRSVAQGEV